MTAKLLNSRDEFRTEIMLRIAEGKSILELASRPSTSETFEQHEKSFRIWNDYNKEWLKHAFTVTTSEYAKQYETSKTTPEKLELIYSGYSPRDEDYRRIFLAKDIATKIEHLESLLSRIDLIPQESHGVPAMAVSTGSVDLAHLHPAVQQATDSLFATNHYPQAIHAACTALEKAIQQKGSQSASVTGTALIGRVFPKDNPLVSLSDDQGEREGYGFLYRGLLQAIRNHYAHNLTPIPAPRALEWLGLISALFYKLDEAQPTAISPVAPSPAT